jgi:hypothetical protein
MNHHSEFIRTKKCNIISFITAGQHSASVADPGCLSCIGTSIHSISPIPHLGKPDPTTAKKEEGKKFVGLPFLVATNVTKLKIFYF